MLQLTITIATVCLTCLLIVSLRAEVFGKDYTNLELSERENDRAKRSNLAMLIKLKHEFSEISYKDFIQNYRNFSKWLMLNLNEETIKSKSKQQLLPYVATRFLADIGSISKETANEGLQFFSNYKDSVGDTMPKIEKAVKAKNVN